MEHEQEMFITGNKEKQNRPMVTCLMNLCRFKCFDCWCGGVAKSSSWIGKLLWWEFCVSLFWCLTTFRPPDNLQSRSTQSRGSAFTVRADWVNSEIQESRRRETEDGREYPGGILPAWFGPEKLHSQDLSHPIRESSAGALRRYRRVSRTADRRDRKSCRETNEQHFLFRSENSNLL